MKLISALVLSLSLVGCGTIGGALNGAGDDLQAVGGWITPNKDKRK
jgi:hypothetical protein